MLMSSRKTKAPCTRIWIFLNPQLFLSEFKNFPVHTKRIQIESYGIPIHSSTQASTAIKSLQSMCHKGRDRGGKLAHCAAILVYCLVRDWTRFCYVIGFKTIRIHPSTRYRIHCGFIFSTLESGFKNIH